MADQKPRKSDVKVAKEGRYSWPPPPDPNDVYEPKEKNAIHSVLTALPVIMLVVGLYFYYQRESAQNEGAPILSESRQTSGIFTGFSEVKSGAKGRHYLWINNDGTTRGFRIQPEQLVQLQQLNKGEDIQLQTAPTVSGSRTLWAWKIQQGETVFLEMDLSKD
ncbi:MAG: hypothetical protein AB8B84_18120 [Granulosicoccus sp.]